VLNFFERRENAERYLAENASVSGYPISLLERSRPEGSSSAMSLRRESDANPVDRDRVQRLFAEGAQLVELLPQAEYEEQHLPGAINFPLKTLDAETTRRLERERPVIVYCHDYQ
jgi:hypothetical protein